jgi:hypothetical protein
VIWIGLALGYIGIGGLVAAWIDHQNRELDDFEALPVLMSGALWLPFLVVGLIGLAVNHLKASGASKPPR